MKIANIDKKRNSENQNKKKWNEIYDWGEQQGGEIWSGGFGSSMAQWYVSILPRLQNHIPADHILEIAPGYGRWTRFLINYSKKFSAVDLSEKCIRFCKNYFGETNNRRFFVNDGKTLADIEDGTVDLVFSYDSLVHVNLEILSCYIPEILRVLKPRGACFLHHSNLASLDVDKIVKKGRYGYRAKDVSANLVKEVVISNRGVVCSQEVHDWGFVREPVDCLTIFGGVDVKGLKLGKFENLNFMRDGEVWRQLTKMYFEDDDWASQSKSQSKPKSSAGTS